MALKLLNKDSSTTQIVKYLEGEILSGRLPPLSKLKPIRELANYFGVSSTLVLAAFNEMERRRLVYREERRGVFVSPMAKRPQMHEIFILVFGDDPERNSFVRQILSIMSCQNVIGKFNFWLRVVTFNTEEMYDGNHTHEVLKSEIARLAPSLHVDGMLIVGPQFKRRDVELCLTLPVNLLFIGSFNDGDFNDLNYNRFGISPQIFELFVQSAASKSAHKVVIIVPRILENAQFFHESFARALRLAEDHRIELALVYQEYFESLDKRMLNAGRRKAMEEALEFHPEMIFLDCVRYIDFAEIFKDMGLENGKCELYFQKNIIHQVDSFPANVRLIGPSLETLDDFNSQLTRLLEKLCRGELNNYQNDYLTKNVT